MIIGLIIILFLTLLFPFAFKTIEHNLEFFLFIMGVSAALVSGVLTLNTLEHIFTNSFIYMITAAVFIVSIVFKYLKDKIKVFVHFILKYMPVQIFVFLLIIILGLLSSIITAIIASLVLVEVISVLPLKRKEKVEINIAACFAIGLGAALTPIGEPISTIVVSKLNADFGYIFRLIGPYVIAGIVGLAILGAYFSQGRKMRGTEPEVLEEHNNEESFKEILLRTVKIFIFVIALELLGSGFKPIIDAYVIGLNGHILFWGNTVSAILDNATLAAAEISPKMHIDQIRDLLIGLLVSGGMLVPGNIPNIITAGKLKIKSGEWAKIGLPIGLTMLCAYYVILFWI